MIRQQTRKLVGLLLLIVAVFVTVLVVRQQQETRQRATGEPVSLYFTLAGSTTPLTQLATAPGQPVSLDLYLGAGTNNVNGFDVTIKSNGSLFINQINDATLQTAFTTEVFRFVDYQNNTARFSKVSTNVGSINLGTIKLGTITLSVPSNASASNGSLDFQNVSITSPANTGSFIGSGTPSISYSVSQPTPTPTITPAPTMTPSPIPTLTPTPFPTGVPTFTPAPTTAPTVTPSPTQAPSLFTVSGRTYIDANQNGANDPGEATYQGAQVHLYSLTSGIYLELANVLTDSTGLYTFPNLQAGTYAAKVDAPTGYSTTTAATATTTLPPNATVNFGVASVPTPTTPPSPTPQPCSQIANNGIQGVDTRQWELGATQGTVLLSYDMYAIPDRLEISYQGATIYTTGGEVSGSANNVPVNFGPGTSTKITVVVTANQSNTAWQYSISCPTTITPTPTPVLGNPLLALSLDLQGVGHPGDNPNPIRLQRSVTVEILNTSATQVLQTATNKIVTFDRTSSKFTGTIDIGALTSGTYAVRIKTDGFVKKLFPGAQIITAGTTNTLPGITLVNGDINGDNIVDINDYNILISCYGNNQNSAACGNNRVLSDFNDDGRVDSIDIGIYIRSLRIQGD